MTKTKKRRKTGEDSGREKETGAKKEEKGNERKRRSS
jgi:hypothetical protein